MTINWQRRQLKLDIADQSPDFFGPVCDGGLSKVEVPKQVELLAQENQV